MQKKKLITKTDWEKILSDETTNATYNETLKNLNELTATDDNTPIEYTNFFKKVKRAGEQRATKLITPPLDWFEMSKEKTQPQIDIVNSIRKQLRECKDQQTINRLKKELKGQQNTQHCNSRSKRTLHVQTSRKNCTISGNEQQSRMESNTGM
jgi:hypothetical protein